MNMSTKNIMASSKDANATWEWYPLNFLQARTSQDRQDFALLVLNGRRLRESELLTRLWTTASVHVAADGGANETFRLDPQVTTMYSLDAIVGDLDSLSQEARTFYQSLPTPAKMVLDPDQYSTDFSKAAKYIRSEAAQLDIVALGGLEGRVDQGISQLHHLYLHQSKFPSQKGDIYILSTHSLTFLLRAGSHRIQVRNTGEQMFGREVGILPIKEPSSITTHGLEWDVTDWHTELGGMVSTSNYLPPSTEIVHVHTTKDVIFTIALKTPL